MGSFHTSCGLSPYLGQHHAREFEGAWGVKLSPEPGLRIPNMFEAALEGASWCSKGQGHRAVDPNTQHVTAALSAMECVVVQDIFLNETAKYAHVFLPGSSSWKGRHVRQYPSAASRG